MLTRKLFRTAKQYKSQFISMIIMIAIGVGVFLGFNIEWKSIEVDTNKLLEQTNYADFRLYSENGFSEEDIEKIIALDGVDAATRFITVNVDLLDGRRSLALNVSENYTVSTMLITEGEAYNGEAEGIWISDKFAEANEIRLGDELKFTYMGVEIAEKVKGLAKCGEHMVCVRDENQLMPDYETFGFGYITPKTFENAMGIAFYPQINLLSGLEKQTLESEIRDALGRTTLVVPKEDHTAYAGASGEVEEGKTMCSTLPILFLAIALLTMITTMHRIAANEKMQIGTLKALGFRDRRILVHYTSYGLVIGLFGAGLGIPLGFGIAAFIISPTGMMSTYFDLPDWSLVMPSFCIPAMAAMVLLLTLISFLSVKKMLQGTPAQVLRPYSPKRMKKSLIERLPAWEKQPFGAKWNTRDVLRHKSRSAMTLVGVAGCMVLLVGGLGMKDTMGDFTTILGDDISNYTTKVNISETAQNSEAIRLAESIEGDWVAASGISYGDKTVSLEVYHADNDNIRFVSETNELFRLDDDGAYLCLRLADTAKQGDMIEFSPYGSDEVYRVRVAGYFRSVMTTSIIMTDKYADETEIPYKISSIYTDKKTEEIESSALISGKQDKATLMESYDSFMQVMNIMIVILVFAAVVLGVVVLYNLGVMSYVERSRELATLKVLGFRDRAIARLLTGQNLWLAVIGILIGIPAGLGVLKYIIKVFASEYELRLYTGVLTYSVSIALTFGVSVIVAWMVSRKNRKINMVEALKDAE